MMIIDFVAAYAPLLLERKAARIRLTMDEEKGDRPVRTVFDKAGNRT